MSTLTNDDKLAIINQHKKNLDYAKYGFEISLIEEQSIDSPSAERITSINNQIAEINKKLEALDEEAASLI